MDYPNYISTNGSSFSKMWIFDEFLIALTHAQNYKFLIMQKLNYMNICAGYTFQKCNHNANYIMTGLRHLESGGAWYTNSMPIIQKRGQN